MGCDTYYINDIPIRFNEMNDDVCCLCTFPFNDNGELSKSRLRSLAMLGAAVVINHHESLREEIEDANFNTVDYLPDKLPKWILNGIDKYLPKEE